MKDSRKSSGVSRVPVANLPQVKKVAEDNPSRVGVKSMLSCSSAARLNHHLSWYVALNPTPSEEKISRIPHIKWKSPPKFAPNIGWCVAGGEESQEAETQKRRETTAQEVVYPRLTAIPPSPLMAKGECSDDSRTLVIPIIPIEEVAEEMPFDINQQLPAPHIVPLVSGSLPSCDLSSPQDQPFHDKTLPDMLHAPERIDLEVAAAAAATVAAVMETKEQIDTELLIKLLTDPVMVKKLINRNALVAMLKNGTPPPPEPNTPLPLPSSTPASVGNKAAAENSNPFSRAVPSDFTPQTVNQSLVLPPKVETEMEKKLIDGNGLTAKLENGTSPAPEKNTPLPFPSSTPVTVVDKVAPECSEPLNRSISCVRHCSEVEREINKSANKKGGIHAGIGPLRTSTLVKISSLTPRPESYVPPHKNLTSELGWPAQSRIQQFAGTRQARPLIPSSIRPDDETMNGLVNKYLTPEVAGIMTVAPLNPSTSKPNVEAIKKMIHEYGAPEASRTKPVAPLITSTSRPPNMEERKKTINEYGLDHRWGNPYIGPSPSLLPPAPMHPMTNHHTLPKGSNFIPPGNVCVPFSSPAPIMDLNYHEPLIKQHGEKQETGEQKLRIIGQHGNYMQGLESTHDNTINPKSRKRCLYFGSSKGCRNGYNCLYQHDVPKQKTNGAMEVPFAKRMKFTERIG